MEPASLRQGYQYNSKNKYESKGVTREWFENLQQNTTNLQSASKKCDPSRPEKFLDRLIDKYQSISDEIKKLEEAYKTQTSNMYLNKNVKFTDGTYAYVTNAGILKKYAGLDMLQKNSNLNGCPPPSFLTLSVPWLPEYDTPGASVQMPSGAEKVKGPVLKVGSPMIAGQSCGHEGSNIMVSQENDNPISRYIGCYDNPGGSYPAATLYTNPNEEPYLNYYPMHSLFGVVGTNAVTHTMSFAFQPGAYTISLQAQAGSPVNPINILVDGVSIFAGDNYLIPTSAFKNYQYIYNLQTAVNSLSLSIIGTSTDPNAASLVQNVRFTNNTANPNAVYTFSTCQGLAKTSNAPYFGFQEGTANDGKGYCFMNMDTSGSFLSSLTSSNSISQETVLSSGTTSSPNMGVAAGVTNSGLLVVYTASNQSKYVQVSTNQGLSNSPNNKVYLYLSNDGRIRILSGGEPDTNNPGSVLWTSNAPKVQPVPNSEYEATKGQYGVNYLKPGKILLPGQWVGSPDGSIYLKMESNGNLNLYASTYSGTCKKSATGNNMQGTLSSAAIYKTNSAEDNFFTNLGKIFSISPDSVLQGYDSNSVAFSNKYEKIANYNNPGTSFNLEGDYSSYNTQQSCQNACTTNKSCYGYAFTNSSGTCQLKGAAIVGDVGGDTVEGTDLYVRQQTLKPPTKTSTEGFETLKFSNVGSTQMQNYVKGPTKTYTPEMSPDINVDQKRQELTQIQEEINNVMQEVLQCNPLHPINPYNPFVPPQPQPNLQRIVDEIDKYRENIQKQDQNASTTNLDNVVEDTTLKVVQESNKYMVWGLLAAASAMVAIGISKI